MPKPKKVFEFAHQVKPFLIKVKHACAWVNENHERFEIDHEVHDSTISRALLGRPVYPGVVDALIELHRIAFDDPWSLCEPPRFEDLAEYAFLPWWYDVLQPDVPLNTWNMMKKRPLSPEREEAVRALYDAWVARLKVACDEHKRNAALTRAFVADVEPQVVEWVLVDGAVRRDVQGPTFKFVRKAPSGLHQWCYLSEVKTEEHYVREAARARALSMIEQALPDVAKASLGYSVNVSDEDVEWAEEMVARMLQSGFAEAVGRAWNGESWEFVLTREWRRKELWRYVWDDAAWDYREELLDIAHQVWVPRRYTGTVIPRHVDEPPEDNRVWIEPRTYVVSKREAPDRPWRDVTEHEAGFWAYPGETKPRVVQEQHVGGEWVEAHWRDATEEDRVFHLTGLRRIPAGPVDWRREEWIANKRRRLMFQNVVGDVWHPIEGAVEPTEEELEAYWLEGKVWLEQQQAEVEAMRDQEIADALAALNTGQPD